MILEEVHQVGPVVAVDVGDVDRFQDGAWSGDHAELHALLDLVDSDEVLARCDGQLILQRS